MNELSPPPHQQHTLREDIIALLTGTLFVALGLSLFRAVGMLSGGTAGLAFLVHYSVGWPLGWAFLLINAPFYVVAWRQMGARFTGRTLVSTGLVALQSELLLQWMQISHINPWFAAIAGGSLCGCGLLILFRHRASLGGLGILALIAQNKYGLSAGQFQMAADSLIVLTALAIASPLQVLLSVVGAIVVNLVLADNHRPGRYQGLS